MRDSILKKTKHQILTEIEDSACKSLLDIVHNYTKYPGRVTPAIRKTVWEALELAYRAGKKSNGDIDDQIQAIVDEYKRARLSHKPFHSSHEGYAVILEELDEVWEEIKKNDIQKAKDELVQVGAMVVAFLKEIKECQKTKQ